jgi:L-rhamnonate dehydratase
MKIANLKASLHQFPVELPGFESALENRRLVFCEVETDDSIKGFGITGQFAPWATIAALEQHILPAIKGLDPRNTEAIHAAVQSRLNPRAFTGAITHALSALDIALWDIRGKKEGRTVAELLGGHRDWAPCYVTFGYPYFDLDQLAEYAHKFIAQGHDCLKMVVAQSEGGWKEDAKRVRAVRDAIGDGIELLIDANCGFGPEEALLLCHAIADCNLTWFEEPLSVNDVDAMADLRRRVAVPLAAGQMDPHRWRHRELIVSRAVDFIQPNVCYSGGYTETLKIAHMAQAFSLRLANGGGWPIFNMHVQAGLMNGGRVEFHYGMWQAGKRLFKGTPDPDGNRMRIPDRPGLGFEPDYDALKETRIQSLHEDDAHLRDAHGYLQRRSS